MTEKSNKTKREFMDSAHRLFLENGFENVSVESICRYTEKAKGLFFYHFGKKENIVKCLLEEQIRQMSSMLTIVLEKMETGNSGKMDFLMNQLISKHGQGPPALGYFSEDLPDWIDLYANSLRDRYVFPIILSIIEEGIQKGEFQHRSREEIEIIYLGISSFIHKKQGNLKNPDFYAVSASAISRTLETALGCPEGSIHIK
ncbi:MAG: TetR/AcrR family transcriptional regulator [Clostridia bacterium]|nr:TetR/AcrR family transcriptional regulator [Clostridia bacterium]MBN2882936.1 TetR/AcrR family transcriptional regulator [Clostridia bacterium]